MEDTTIVMVEDCESQIATAKLISKNLGFNIELARDFDEGIELMSRISDLAGNIILCLDGQFPGCKQKGEPGLILLKEERLLLPTNTFLIANSAVSGINDSMVDIWTNYLQRESNKILSSVGKSDAFLSGVKEYNQRLANLSVEQAQAA